MSSELRQWEGTPLSPRNLNVTLEPGTHICSIGDPKKLETVIVVDQSKIDFVVPGSSVKIKLNEFPSVTLLSEVREIDDVERQKMESAPFQLSAKGGGPVATETVEGGEERPQSASFRVRVDLDEPENLDVKVGMTAKAKIKARPQTLLQRLTRLVREVFNFKL